MYMFPLLDEDEILAPDGISREGFGIAGVQTISREVWFLP